MVLSRKITYALQFITLLPLIGFFAILPVGVASNIGAFLGRSIGPRLGANRKALRHLTMALPGKSNAEYETILKQMWENLGRVFAEYPHLKTLATQCEIVGDAQLIEMTSKGLPAIIFSGHIGNWELQGPTALMQRNIQLNAIVRAPNNPYVAWMLKYFREINGKINTIPKSASGTRQLVKRLKDGNAIGILIDQKYNEGVLASFFGQPAMTSTAFVQMAQKFKCPLIPARMERVQGTQFRVTLFPSLQVFDDNGNPRPMEDVVAEAHTILEQWITERPDQWIWMHHRWDVRD